MLGVMLGAALLPTPCARAQDDPGDPASPDASEIERYLMDRGLRDLLAVHLLHRLKGSEGASRQAIADRLGRLYVEMFERAGTSDERDAWRGRSEELLRAVPEADSFDLRINLTKVTYLRAEEAAERHRLRLTSAQELADAERDLRAAAEAFQEIAAKVHRRVDALERRETAGRDEDTAGLRAALADARRLRSLAMYYAGWSNYYLAMLADRPQGLGEALTQFGWLLNASGGREASPERLPASLLRYEHVARAAIGSSLCESLRGNHETAIRWLDAVADGEEVSAGVLDQVVSRRLVVFARAKRWADLETLVRQLRAREPADGRPPMPVGEVRLLAVVTLEALAQEGVARLAVEIVQRLAERAVADLIEQGEVRHVLDLVSRYGTGTLSGEGFIVNYVRGLQAYEKARGAHTAGGGNPDEPVAADGVANQYRQAAASLDIALGGADAQRFPAERANAGLLLGLCLYYANDLEHAADRFEAVHTGAANPTQAEEALWLAVVALDRAVEGKRPSLKPRRDRLATLFVRSFPKTERAARLLLHQASGGILTEEEAVDVLLSLERDSPVYAAARRHAAELLYRVYRRARGTARDFAALRFAGVAEEVIAGERAAIESGDEAVSRAAAERVVVWVRQTLDAVLGMSAPDLERAARALEQLDATAAYTGMSLADAADELAYRRLQIALAKGDAAEVNRRLEELTALGGRWADAASRLMYRRALAAFNGAPEDAGAAREVVRHGLRVIAQFGEGVEALADASVASLHNTVAGAADVLWERERDESMRDLALRLDRGLIESGSPSAPVLRRFARASESVGDGGAALDAWRRLLIGLRADTPGWFEARFHSLRLLTQSDPARAREALDQHKALHPEFGPEPWGPRLRALDSQIPSGAAPRPEGTSPPDGGGGGG